MNLKNLFIWLIKMFLGGKKREIKVENLNLKIYIVSLKV